MKFIETLFVLCSEELSKQVIENILELEEKVGDAGAYEPFIREAIANSKFHFYFRFGATITDKIGAPKYEQLKIQFQTELIFFLFFRNLAHFVKIRLNSFL